MSRRRPDCSDASDGASPCSIVSNEDCTPRLSREARVLAVSDQKVLFELLALPSCGSCPGGMFCPSSRMRAAQTVALNRDDRKTWRPGDRAQLQIHSQSASPVAWKLFGWPLMGLLLMAALLSLIVPSPYLDIAIVAVAPVVVVMALWAARNSLSTHSLVIDAVAIGEAAGPSPGA